MSRAYFDMKTNIRQLNDKVQSPPLDKLFFQCEDRYYEVECQGEADYGYSDGFLSGSWKGQVLYREVDAALVPLDDDFKEITPYCFLSDARTRLIGFRIDEDALDAQGYTAAFVPYCEFAAVSAVVYNQDAGTEQNFSFRSFQMKTEGELIAAASEGRGV